MARTIANVGPVLRAGVLIELDDEEKQTILDERNAEAEARAAREAAQAAVAYRRQRAVAYRDELGAERGDFILTIGDVLDVVLGWAEREIDAGRLFATDELADLLSKRNDIKSRFPKS